MQIKITDEMTLFEMLQAICEKVHEIEDLYAVRCTRGATLYINPTNGFGDEVIPKNTLGQRVRKVRSKGPYRSAADDYKI